VELKQNINWTKDASTLTCNAP